MTGRGSTADATATGSFAAEKKAPNNPCEMRVYSVAICKQDDSWACSVGLKTFGIR